MTGLASGSALDMANARAERWKQRYDAATARADDFEARLDRINDRARKWMAMDDASDYEDPSQIFRDCAVIVLHLACGRTFP